jgi:hypothetical protein
VDAIRASVGAFGNPVRLSIRVMREAHAGHQQSHYQKEEND